VSLRIYIADYDEKWPALYEEIRGPLVEVFGGYASEMHHVGSTSVPGLGAKPIIDIAVDLLDYPLPQSVIAAMEALGYTHMGEYGITGRHYFKRYQGSRRQPGSDDGVMVHVHAYSPGNEELTRHIIFRDYLRAHPEAARDYETLKRDLASKYADQREVYTESKTGFVQEILRKAGSG
jgi:GrpB-like predicted nucleotidyltransferase (UPF0157 family)